MDAIERLVCALASGTGEIMLLTLTTSHHITVCWEVTLLRELDWTGGRNSESDIVPMMSQ